MTNCFNDHDMDMTERQARVESKLDYLIQRIDENETTRKATAHAQWQKIDEVVGRVTVMEAERKVYWRILTPLLSLVSGVMGGVISTVVSMRLAR